MYIYMYTYIYIYICVYIYVYIYIYIKADGIIFQHCLSNSADDKSIIFFYFSQKMVLDKPCKLSPKETICKKCQTSFSWKIKKNILKCRLLEFIPSMQSDIFH